MSYAAFLDAKAQLGSMDGFDPVFMPEFLFDFQHALVDWSVRKGRSALFADCGLGKTPMLLVWAENVVRFTNRPVLILTPLAVSYQTILEAEKFGIEAHRSVDGTVWPGINVTNYERLHYFNPADFAGVVCDESSILKSFDGARKAEITEFMRLVQYRLLDTATAAPNDYIELGTSSEALGELGYTDMLMRFFKNDQHTVKPMSNYRHKGSNFAAMDDSAKWRLKGHAEHDFWRWVSSWARAMRRPSDLGFCDARFILPELIERSHMVDVETIADGFLFSMTAVGLKEQREERRRSIAERCDKVVELVGQRVREPSLVWCSLNDEGDHLEAAMPHAIQVAGRHDDEYKEKAAMWFAGSLCLCGEPLFRAKLPAWRSENQIQNTSTPTIWLTESGDLLKPPNISATMPPKSAPTTPSTKPKIENASESKPGHIGKRTEKPGSPSARLNTPLILQNSSLPPESGSAPIPESALISECDNTASPQTDMTSCSVPKEGGALSAGQTIEMATPEAVASTSITATRQGQLEDYSARLAISALVSSGMTQIDLNAPQCICGHQSGKRVLISKQSMFGWGLNFQACAHVTAFPSHSFEQYYQGVRRCWRFGQTRPVVVDMITSDGEKSVLANLQRKAVAADEMFTQLVAHMNDALRIERGVNFTKKEETPAWL